MFGIRGMLYKEGGGALEGGRKEERLREWLRTLIIKNKLKLQF